MKKVLQIVICIAFVIVAASAQAGTFKPGMEVPTSTPLQPAPEGVKPNYDRNINSVTTETDSGEEDQTSNNAPVPPEGAEDAGSGTSDKPSAGAAASGTFNAKALYLTLAALIVVAISYVIYRKRSGNS